MIYWKKNLKFELRIPLIFFLKWQASLSTSDRSVRLMNGSDSTSSALWSCSGPGWGWTPGPRLWSGYHCVAWEIISKLSPQRRIFSMTDRPWDFYWTSVNFAIISSRPTKSKSKWRQFRMWRWKMTSQSQFWSLNSSECPYQDKGWQTLKSLSSKKKILSMILTFSLSVTFLTDLWWNF